MTTILGKQSRNIRFFFLFFYWGNERITAKEQKNLFEEIQKHKKVGCANEKYWMKIEIKKV